MHPGITVVMVHKGTPGFSNGNHHLPIGERLYIMHDAQNPADPDALAVRVHVDGALVHQTTTGERIRPVARLLAEVSAFMTLSPGDVLFVRESLF